MNACCSHRVYFYANYTADADTFSSLIRIQHNVQHAPVFSSTSVAYGEAFHNRLHFYIEKIKTAS